jgi:hypothetical protein
METAKILFSTFLTSSDLRDQCILRRFLVLPSIRKFRDEISAKGGRL